MKPAAARVVESCVTEKDFARALVDLAHLTGWLLYHTHDSRRSPAGFPDLVLVRALRVVYAELKTARGRVTPDQKVWLHALQQAGQEVHVWRPGDWPDLEAALR